MELLGLALLLVLVLGVVVFIILLFTRGVFARDLTQALKRVTQQEQTLQEQAEILEQRINQMERDYHAKLKRAEAEAARLIEDAKNQAMNIRTAAIEEAKHRARQLLLEAEQGKVQLRLDVASDLNGQAARHACDALRALLPPAALHELHTALVRQLVETLQQMEVKPPAAGVDRVAVVTGQPLTQAEVQQLTQWAAAVVGTPVPLDVKTDAALVAGCIVRLGPTIMDNSLLNRVDQR